MFGRQILLSHDCIADIADLRDDLLDLFRLVLSAGVREVLGKFESVVTEFAATIFESVDQMTVAFKVWFAGVQFHLVLFWVENLEELVVAVSALQLLDEGSVSEFIAIVDDLPVKVVESGVTSVNVFFALIFGLGVEDFVHLPLDGLEEAFCFWIEGSLEVTDEFLVEGQVAENLNRGSGSLFQDSLVLRVKSLNTHLTVSNCCISVLHPVG